MSVTITHDNYVASVRARVVRIAESMLSGNIDFLEGSIELVSLKHDAAFEKDDEDFMAFVAIDSEIDNLPIGAVRAHWSQEALALHQPQIEAAIVWAKGFGVAACESLINKFRV